MRYLVPVFVVACLTSPIQAQWRKDLSGKHNGTFDGKACIYELKGVGGVSFPKNYLGTMTIVEPGPDGRPPALVLGVTYFPNQLSIFVDDLYATKVITVRRYFGYKATDITRDDNVAKGIYKQVASLGYEPKEIKVNGWPVDEYSGPIAGPNLKPKSTATLRISKGPKRVVYTITNRSRIDLKFSLNGWTDPTLRPAQYTLPVGKQVEVTIYVDPGVFKPKATFTYANEKDKAVIPGGSSIDMVDHAGGQYAFQYSINDAKKIILGRDIPQP